MTVKILKSSSVVAPEIYECESREQAHNLLDSIADLMIGDGLEIVQASEHHRSYRSKHGAWWSFTIVEDVAPSRWWTPASPSVVAPSEAEVDAWAETIAIMSDEAAMWAIQQAEGEMAA